MMKIKDGEAFIMQAIINQNYQLKDNIHAATGRIFLTGTQALVRMLLSQAKRDVQAHLNTAGFVSGYRGSPLGGVDTAMWHHSKALEAANIHFQPAINEDLAATMLMGTQQLDTHPDKNVEGVWYVVWQRPWCRPRWRCTAPWSCRWRQP